MEPLPYLYGPTSSERRFYNGVEGVDVVVHGPVCSGPADSSVLMQKSSVVKNGSKPHADFA